MQPDLTLVINIAAGDITYARLTVGALAKAHRKSTKEIILIVDDTKAQFSKFYNHQQRYSEPLFTQNLACAFSIASDLKNEGLVDTIIVASEFTDKKLYQKFFGRWITATHDFRGAPIMAYLIGFLVCKTQYLVRYDGDMLLHQTDLDWALTGINLTKKYPDCIAVSPRPSPAKSGKKTNSVFDPTYWFSTRCVLFDCFKLDSTTPFITVKYGLELLVRKLLKKTYPPAFETMLFKKLKSLQLKNYYLLDYGCWILHPENKNEAFINMLPALLSEIYKGNFPTEQIDQETLNLAAWQNYLKNKAD